MPKKLFMYIYIIIIVDVMYFLLPFNDFLSVYNGIRNIIMCGHLNERIIVYIYN